MNNKIDRLPVKDKVLKEIVKSIDDKKGNDTVVIDLRKFDNVIADYFVITDATSHTQVKAISDHIREQLRDRLRKKPWGVEGEENADWILLDYGDVIVHVFRRPVREYYDLEGLWGDADMWRPGENESENAG
ncbi:MAG: ribosome silencing factor [Chlorobi bacterium]|nr:ribosome silencing factor [Chlorobiota bacterium]